MIKSKHLLTGNELSAAELNHILNLAMEMKQSKKSKTYARILEDKSVALIFEKPSLRTRFSFTAAVKQLGGEVIESVSQTRKAEQPKDFIQVIQGYCDAMMIRTYDDKILEEMQAHAKIPIINGLTDNYHPCQTLADLLTLKECFNSYKGLNLCYVGDGNNVLHSLLIMATKLGIQINYCCPTKHEPKQAVLKMLQANATAKFVKKFTCPQEAVKNCHAVYTDVWTSMGFDSKDEADFYGFQVNEALMAAAAKEAIFMHCMPMNRGKEVSATLPDQACSVIYQQSENRLHVQKALLVNILAEEQ